MRDRGDRLHLLIHKQTPIKPKCRIQDDCIDEKRYYHYLSLGKVTGREFSLGPIKDVNVTAGVNAGATTGDAGTRILLYGFTVELELARGGYFALSGPKATKAVIGAAQTPITASLF